MYLSLCHSFLRWARSCFIIDSFQISTDLHARWVKKSFRNRMTGLLLRSLLILVPGLFNLERSSSHFYFFLPSSCPEQFEPLSKMHIEYCWLQASSDLSWKSFTLPHLSSHHGQIVLNIGEPKKNRLFLAPKMKWGKHCFSQLSKNFREYCGRCFAFSLYHV